VGDVRNGTSRSVGIAPEVVAIWPDMHEMRCNALRRRASYPTDSGLLAKAIGRVAATQKRIQAAGGPTRTKVRDRSRAARKRAHAVGAKLRSRRAAGAGRGAVRGASDDP
jgi:hypothetical protein